MQLDDLKNTWEREITMENNMTEFGDMRRRADKFDRRANVGWAMELLAIAGIVIFVLLRWLVWPPSEGLSLLFQLGNLAVVVCGIFVIVKIVSARRVSTIDDWTLFAKINIQIEKREKGIKLLNTAAYWYLTPLFVIVILSSYGGYAERTGSYIPNTGLWTLWVVSFIFFIWAYFYLQYQSKTKVQPILEQLYEMKRELER